MREIALFVEDHAHQQVIGALVRRLADSHNIQVHMDWRSTRRGHGKVATEFETFMHDLKRQGGKAPDMIIVATDANCKGLNDRTKEFPIADSPAPVILAIPDPHIERWLLLDGAAFKAVCGKGCDAPDQKCSRDRYKERLIMAIINAGISPSLGGVEFAEDIVARIDIDRASRSDPSFKRFVDQLADMFQGWRE
jgi:hypothetical protein